MSGLPGLYRHGSRKMVIGWYAEYMCVLLPKLVWNPSLARNVLANEIKELLKPGTMMNEL